MAADNAKGIAGTWNLAIKADHVVPVAMELTQDGTKVKGTLMLPNGDFELAGEFDGATLTVTGTQENVDGQQGKTGKMDFTAKMNEDGTLTGEFKSPHGLLPWTGERMKKRKAEN
jgi:hypothetical protein